VATRTCRKCGKTKDLEDFPRYGGKKNTGGRRGLCGDCYRAYRRERWRRKHEANIAAQQVWYQKNRKEVNRRRRDRHQQRRREVLEYYSGGPPRCACCGEWREEFLCIDHVDGGGTQHRNKVSNIYQWLRKKDYPEGFQVLCHNCNMARGLYGYCPHEKEKK